MAIVKCNNCGHKASVGFMPTTTCGMLLILPMGAAVAGAIIATETAWPSWGWLSLLVPAPVFAAIFLVAACAVHYLPWTLEYLLVCWRKCPKCGKCRWSYPFTEGFGL
jgi:uncharacterized protein (DUF983 family)